MANRPVAVALAAGALLGLLAPGAAAAQDGAAFPHEVSGGYLSWTAPTAEPAGHGVTLTAQRPAVQGAAGRTWFPATGGGADPETGAADIALGGTARLDRSAAPDIPLVLAGLRLRLAAERSALYARTERDGAVRELAVAEVTADGAGPAVRTGGVTWSGLRAALTEEGARLLSAWSGEEFAAGDALGELDVTVGTGGGGESTEKTPPAPAPPAVAEPEPQATKAVDPAAAVTHPTLAPGGEQRIAGEGFAPGAVVLLAIDGDTRYQAVADAEGRVARTFPLYATAAEGEHTAELYTVTGQQGRAVARFTVTGS